MDKMLNPSELIIKKIKKNDPKLLEELIDIDRQSFGDAGLDEWGLVPIIRHGRIYALYYQENIAGAAQFLKDWEEPQKAYLYGVGIKEKYRGKGLGTWFLKTCFEQLKDEGIRRIELTVDPANQSAIRVYQEKIGFQKKEERKNEYGEGEHRIVMELEWKP